MMKKKKDKLETQNKSQKANSTEHQREHNREQNLLKLVQLNPHSPHHRKDEEDHQKRHHRHNPKKMSVWDDPNRQLLKKMIQVKKWMRFRPALLSVMTLHRKEQKRRTFLQETYDGEVPNERDDEHANNVHCESFGGETFVFVFWSSMRLNKAFDAQNGTAKVWTVGPLTMNLWSHTSAIHIVITLTTESCERVMCDGCVDIN